MTQTDPNYSRTHIYICTHIYMHAYTNLGRLLRIYTQVQKKTHSLAYVQMWKLFTVLILMCNTSSYAVDIPATEQGSLPSSEEGCKYYISTKFCLEMEQEKMTCRWLFDQH